MAGALNLQNQLGVNATGNRTGGQQRRPTPPRGGGNFRANANPGGPNPTNPPGGGAVGQRARNYRQVNQGF